MHARLPPGAEGRDAAAEPEVADGIVGHGDARVGERADVPVIDPNAWMTTVCESTHAFIRRDLHQRAAIDLVAQRALRLGLEDMDVEGQLATG